MHDVPRSAQVLADRERLGDVAASVVEPAQHRFGGRREPERLAARGRERRGTATQVFGDRHDLSGWRRPHERHRQQPGLRLEHQPVVIQLADGLERAPLLHDRGLQVAQQVRVHRARCPGLPERARIA